MGFLRLLCPYRSFDMYRYRQNIAISLFALIHKPAPRTVMVGGVRITEPFPERRHAFKSIANAGCYFKSANNAPMRQL